MNQKREAQLIEATRNGRFAEPGIHGPKSSQRSRHAQQLLDRASKELLQAVHAVTVAERYRSAHLAALRAAAAVVAIRRPMRYRRAPLSVWELLKISDPEFSQWSEFFASGAAIRSAIEAGRSEIVTKSQANDLLRDAERFVSIVRRSLEAELGSPSDATFAAISA